MGERVIRLAPARLAVRSLAWKVGKDKEGGHGQRYRHASVCRVVGGGGLTCYMAHQINFCFWHFDFFFSAWTLQPHSFRRLPVEQRFAVDKAFFPIYTARQYWRMRLLKVAWYGVKEATLGVSAWRL